MESPGRLSTADPEAGADSISFLLFQSQQVEFSCNGKHPGGSGCHTGQLSRQHSPRWHEDIQNCERLS